MNRWRSSLVFACGLLLLQFCAGSAQACTACFGQSDSSLARGMNMGIFALLLVITSVLCAIAGFFVFLARRTAHLEEATSRFSKTLSQNQSNA
jgi:hypothetical protein